MKKFFVIAGLVLFAVGAQAQKVGGAFNLRISADPTTLHPITSTDLYSRDVQGYVLDSLLTIDDDTYELQPALAEKYEVLKDGMEFIFTLRDGAKWHDGKPVTVDDVKFSFDAIFNPDFNAVHLRPYYENIEKCEILDQKRVRFVVKKKYFDNLNSVATMSIIPKHVYSDTKAKLNKTLIGSGPYTFDSYDRGKKIVLKRNKDWWGWGVKEFKNRYNFEQVIFRIVKEDEVAFEMLKKGDIDFMELTPEQYVMKATGPEWGTKVIKNKVENKSPKGYGYIGWNMTKDMFKEKNVRLALAMLLNRPLMNEKFRYNMSLLQNGPVYMTSDYASKNVKPVPYDPKKALEILKKAGWEDKDKNGVLDKTVNGQKQEFRFTLMTAAEDSMKYLTVFKEDAKKVGIDVELKVLEWNSFIKLLDENKFDAVTLAWGGGSVDPDLKQIWHSSSAVPGGSNFIYYKNPEVDKAIDQARETMDRKKRIALTQKAFEKIADDAPYAWLFTNRYTLYAHSAKIKKVKDTFTYAIGTAYWWME